MFRRESLANHKTTVYQSVLVFFPHSEPCFLSLLVQQHSAYFFDALEDTRESVYKAKQNSVGILFCSRRAALLHTPIRPHHDELPGFSTQKVLVYVCICNCKVPEVPQISRDGAAHRGTTTRASAKQQGRPIEQFAVEKPENNCLEHFCRNTND